MTITGIDCPPCKTAALVVVIGVALAVLGCTAFLVWTLIEFWRLLP